MNTFRYFYLILKTFSDYVVLALCFLFSLAVVKTQFGINVDELVRTRDLLFLFLLLIGWFYSARVVGLYDEFRSRSRVFEFKALLQVVLMQAFCGITFAFVLKLGYIGQLFLLLYCGSLLSMLVLWKLSLNTILNFLRKNGRNLRRFIIVGNGEKSKQFCQLIIDNPHLGYQMAGYVDDIDRSATQGALYRGAIASIETLIRTEGIDEIVISLPSSENDKIKRVVEICEQYPVMVRMIPDLLEQLTTRFAISLFRDFPIITVRRNPLDELQWRFVKRTADIVFSLVFLVCFASWLFPLIAVAIKLTSPGPVFFKQERLGKKGRRIFCYKFRSMAARSSDTDLQGAYRQAVRGDSRITPLGRILRKTNLDETPQFFNVLFGQMSLVGPRPHPLPLNEKSVNEVDRYLLRHLVKPGITGWAQVHGLRGGTEHPDLMRKRIEHDIWYIENWSFALDLNICTLTLLNAFAGEKNAY